MPQVAEVGLDLVVVVVVLVVVVPVVVVPAPAPAPVAVGAGRIGIVAVEGCVAGVVYVVAVVGMLLIGRSSFVDAVHASRTGG